MSPKAPIRGRLPRTLILLLVVGGLLVPAAPAVAATAPQRSITSREKAFFRVDGVRYGLRVEAGRSEVGDWLMFTLSRNKDLEGVARSSAEAELLFDGFTEVVTVASDLTGGRVRTGDPSAIRPYGAAGMRFVGTGDLRDACGGQIRNGHWMGSATVDLAKIGEVTIDMDDVSAAARSGQCIPSSYPCSDPVRAVAAQRFTGPTSLDIRAIKLPGADTALIQGVASNTPRMGQAGVHGYRYETYETVVPAQRVSIPADLATAAFSAPDASFTTGSASFEATGEPSSPPPQACGVSEQAQYTSRPGLMTPDMVLQNPFGADRAFDTSPENAFAYKYRTTPAPSS
jgi:hypothetical protein